MRFPIAAIGMVVLTAPVAAQPIEFSALVRAELGYGSNPFLRTEPGQNKAVGLGGITVSPKLVKTTTKSVTTLSGTYDREEYFSRYGNTESASVALARTDRFNERLTSTLSARYLTTNRTLLENISDVAIIDPLNTGQRTENITGNFGLQYQATASDAFNVGVNGSRLTYGGSKTSFGSFASNYTQYGFSGGYDRTVDARTSVGVQGSMTTQHSKIYPQSTSYQPALTARRQLNAIWNVQGHLGVVLQKVGGPLSRSTTSLGFGAAVCAVYPRTSLCVYADQGSAPSGFGGLRKDLNFRATLGHDLTEHSHVSLSASYDDSNANQALTPSAIRKSKSFQARGDYSRDLTQRISAGFGGRYQTRDTPPFGKAHELAATVNISAKLGRI